MDALPHDARIFDQPIAVTETGFKVFGRKLYIKGHASPGMLRRLDDVLKDYFIESDRPIIRKPDALDISVIPVPGMTGWGMVSAGKYHHGGDSVTR